MDDVSEFIKKELIYYINQELSKGKPIESIRSALINSGHNNDMIDYVIKLLKKHNFDIVKALEEELPDYIKDKEIFYDVLNSLVKYIEFHLSQGMKLSKIKETLTEYGHSMDDIQEAIRIVQEKRKLKLKSLVIPAIILCHLVFILFISSGVKEPVSNVFIAFSAVSATIILNLFINTITNNKAMLWISPFVTTILFYYISTTAQVETLRLMQLTNITFVNFIMSLAYTYVYYTTVQNQVKTPAGKNKEKKHPDKEDNKKDIKPGTLKPVEI